MLTSVKRFLTRSVTGDVTARTMIVILLFTYCVASVIYVYNVSHVDIVFTHLFYLPIILAGLWFGLKAVLAAGLLGTVLVVSNIFSPIDIPLFPDIQRAVMFVIVGSVVGTIMEQRLGLENRLEEKAIQIKTLWDNTRAGITVVDSRNGTIVDVNTQVAAKLRVARDNIIGREFSSFFLSGKEEVSADHPDTFDSADYVLSCPDGRHIPILLSGSTVTMDGRKHLLASFIDISERERAHGEIANLKKQMEFVLGVTQTGLDIIDSDFNIRYIDPVWERKYGDPRGLKCYEYFMDHKKPCPGCGAKSAFEQGTCTITEGILPKEGNRPIQVVSTPFRDENGQMLVAEVKTDISDRLLADRKIHRQAALIDNVQDAIFLYNPEGTIISWNRGAERIFGWAEDEAVSRKAVDLVFSNNRELYEESLKILSDKGVWRGEIAPPAKDGSQMVCDCRCTLMRDAQGALESTLCVATDITAHKQMEQQLLHSQKMESIGRLAGGVAHDFNNYLTSIMGNAELLMMKLAPEDPHRDKASVIMETAKRASHLTHQLLAFSRKQPSSPSIINPNNVLRLMEKMCGQLVGEDVEYHFNLDPSVRRIYADPGQIEQVVLNLIVNARDAMPQGGKLHIAMENTYLDQSFCETHAKLIPGPYVRLSVSDTGKGISEEIINQIFEPFYTTKETGTGLGLSTVYSIVSQHGGDIDINSQAGRGTTFIIYLPAGEEKLSQVDKEGAPSNENMPQGSGTILVVEDEAVIRDFVFDTLTSFGYKVVTAGGGKEALLAVGESGRSFDLLLVDVILPDIRGPEVFKNIEEQRPGIKVIFMSGYTDERIADDDILQGKVNFLPKPFSATSLLKKVRDVLGSASGP